MAQPRVISGTVADLVPPPQQSVGDLVPENPTLVKRFLEALRETSPAALVPTVDQAIDALPAIGGAAGGIVGGIGGTVAGFGVGGVPGALGGAAVGGAGGEALRRTIQQLRGVMPVDTSTSQTLGAIGTEGAKQAAYELAGQGIGRAVPAAGRAVYRQAVGRLPESITSSFPNVVDVLLKNRVPLTQAGRAQLIAKSGEAASATKSLLERAGNDGITFDAGNIIEKPLLELIDQISAIPAGTAEERALGHYVDDYLARHPEPLTPQAVKDMKQAAQQISSGLFDAQSKGGVVGAEAGVYGKFNQAVAKGTQRALEDAVPGMAEAEGRSQELIGARKAVRQVLRRPPGAVARAVPKATGLMSAAVGELLLPHGGVMSDVGRTAIEYGVGDLLGHFAATPQALSTGALVLTQPQIAALFRQSPRLAADVLQRVKDYTNNFSVTQPTGGTISIESLGK